MLKYAGCWLTVLCMYVAAQRQRHSYAALVKFTLKRKHVMFKYAGCWLTVVMHVTAPNVTM